MAVPEVPVFSEEQRFEPCISMLIVVAGVPVPVVLSVEMGVRGMLLGTVVALAPLALFVPARLTAEVTESGLSVQLFPFHLRARWVPFSEIESVEQVQLSASSYGVGWTRAGWTYTVAGTDGVRIRRDDRDLFVGTQRPEELMTALQRFDRDGWSE